MQNIIKLVPLAIAYLSFTTFGEKIGEKADNLLGIEPKLEEKNHGYLQCGPPPSPFEYYNAGTSHLSNYSSEQILIKPDVGFYPFLFGEAGTYAKQNYLRESCGYELFEVVDCYCGGDQFAIFDHGKFVNDLNIDCELAQPDCKSFSNNVQKCYLGGANERAWCKVQAVLAPGFHNLTVGTLVSPYTSGTAFVRLSKLCQNNGKPEPCCIATNNCNYSVVGDKPCCNSTSSTSSESDSCSHHHHHHRHRRYCHREHHNTTESCHDHKEPPSHHRACRRPCKPEHKSDSSEHCPNRKHPHSNRHSHKPHNQPERYGTNSSECITAHKQSDSRSHACKPHNKPERCPPRECRHGHKKPQPNCQSCQRRHKLEQHRQSSHKPQNHH